MCAESGFAGYIRAPSLGALTKLIDANTRQGFSGDCTPRIISISEIDISLARIITRKGRLLADLQFHGQLRTNGEDLEGPSGP